MTEPVAYLNRYQDESTNITRYKPENNHLLSSRPLYTSDKLQPKIQLTNSEYELLAKVCRGIAPFNKIESNIEIVPDMKWFVRSKEKSSGQFWYLKKTEHFFFHEYIKEISTQFDTKEEAEKWKNPLTEVVLLPIEGDD